MNLQDPRRLYSDRQTGTLAAVAWRFGLLCLLWWSLTGGAHDSWPFGLAIITLATVASGILQPAGAGSVSVTGLLAFLGFFLLQSVKGGAQVALMALRPRLDLQPAMLEIPLQLQCESDRLLLASLLNLLPGTLSTGLDGRKLTLHVLDARLPIEHEVRNAETRIARLFRRDSL